MQRRLVATYLLLVTVALTVFTVPVAASLGTLLRDNLQEVALREARTMAFLVATSKSVEAVRALRIELEEQTGGRVEIIDEQGRAALGRRVESPDGADLRRALAGAEDVAWRTESVVGQPALVVAVPTKQGNRTVGAVRLTYPSRSLDEQIRWIWTFRTGVGLVTMAAAAGLAVLLARSLTRPMRQVNQMADRLSSGDLAARTAVRGPVEVRALATTLNTAAGRLQTLVTAQQSFVADASHQLRTPLAALRLTLDNLGDTLAELPGNPGTTAARAGVERSIAEVVRMSRLVNGLLQLARAQGDGAARQPLEVGSVLRERAEVWQASAADREVSVEVTAAGGLYTLAVPGHLEQVLDNILSNAVEVSPPHSVITVSARRDDSRIAVEVTDQGPGMTPEQRLRAFDRFWHNRPGGTGLGLAIVRQLVEDSGGTVTLHPVPPTGLRVRVLLPAGQVGQVNRSEGE